MGPPICLGLTCWHRNAIGGRSVEGYGARVGARNNANVGIRNRLGSMAFALRSSNNLLENLFGSNGMGRKFEYEFETLWVSGIIKWGAKKKEIDWN
jgi:hypothetical protein